MAFIIRTLHNVDLLGQQRPLVVPLGVEDALPVLGVPSWLLRLIHGLWEVAGWLEEPLRLRRQRHRLMTLRRRLHHRRGGCLSFAAACLLGCFNYHGTANGRALILLVVMDTLHVVKQVVPSWKAIARNSTFASRVVAQVRPVAMSVHSMCFSFMPE